MTAAPDTVEALIGRQQATLDRASWWIVHMLTVGGYTSYAGAFLTLWDGESWMLPALAFTHLTPSLASLPLARTGRPQLAAEIAVGAMIAGVFVGQLQPFDPAGIQAVPHTWEYVEFGYLFLSVALFTLHPSATRRLGAVQALAVCWMMLIQSYVHPEFWADHLMRGGSNLMFLAVGAVGLWFQERQQRAIEQSLRDHAARLDTLANAAERLASGDLQSPVPQESDALVALERMRHLLHGVLQDLQRAAAEVAVATSSLGDTTVEQAAGAQQQSTMVHESQQAVGQVASDAIEVAASAAQLRAQAATAAALSGQVSESLDALLTAAEQIDTILAAVRDLSFKSDMLAINAALEGARAGAAGAGFVHIAARMRALTADVQASVSQLTTLNEQVVEASDATRTAMTKLVASSQQTSSVTAQIHDRTTAQSAALGQTRIHLDSIAGVTAAFAQSSEDLQGSTATLADLVQRLNAATDGLSGRAT